MAQKLFRILNLTRGTLVCDRARIADGFLTRLVGLLGKRYLSPGEGLLITPSSGVHTFGMVFPIDVLSLDQNSRIIQITPDLGPWRISGISLKTRSVLELPDGQCARSQSAVGDFLSILPAEAAHEPDGEAASPQREPSMH